MGVPASYPGDTRDTRLRGRVLSVAVTIRDRSGTSTIGKECRGQFGYDACEHSKVCAFEGVPDSASRAPTTFWGNFLRKCFATYWELKCTKIQCNPPKNSAKLAHSRLLRTNVQACTSTVSSCRRASSRPSRVGTRLWFVPGSTTYVIDSATNREHGGQPMFPPHDLGSRYTTCQGFVGYNSEYQFV